MIKGRKLAVVICAGGTGERMGLGKPKQFIELDDGTSIVRKAVDVFRSEDLPARPDIITVTSPEGSLNETERLVNSGTYALTAHVIPGGRERQDSVRNALSFLEGQGISDDDIVLIHDGARPFVTTDIIAENLKAALVHGAAVTAVPVKDTIRDLEKGTLDRSMLYSVQTPQSFRFGIIRDAVYEACSEGFYGTDDGSLAERAGIMPVIVPGSYANIKITTPEDIR